MADENEREDESPNAEVPVVEASEPPELDEELPTEQTKDTGVEDVAVQEGQEDEAPVVHNLAGGPTSVDLNPNIY